MKSMTGYGRFSHSSPELELDLSLKGVNGRFLEIRFHMPREYGALEPELKKLIGQSFLRGTVDVYVNRRPGPQTDTVGVQVRTGLAKKWLEAYTDLAKELRLSFTPDVEAIARLPDVLQLEESAQVTEAERQVLLQVLGKAVQACEQERMREGAALESELMRLVLDLETRVATIETMRADANRELEKKYRDRLARLGLDTTIDGARLAQEIVMQIDRADINEEIHRLREHIKAYRDLLTGKESQGKKLDFYAQELLREVNTIGSKSQIAALTNAVVDAKALIERIRELVQNVE